MKKSTKMLLIGGPLAVMTTLGVGAVTAFAATPSPTTNAAADASTVFVGKLAAILHLTPAQTTTDLKTAESQTIDQMVKDGKLTQAQADAMKQRLASEPGILFGGPGMGHGPGGPGGRGGFRFDAATGDALRSAEINAAATALGLTAADLQSQLAGGKTLAQVETAKGVSDATVRAALVDAAKKVLDPAVKAGTLTQAQEDQAIQHIQSETGLPGGPRPNDGDADDAPGGQVAPAATPTT